MKELLLKFIIEDLIMLQLMKLKNKNKKNIEIKIMLKVKLDLKLSMIKWFIKSNKTQNNINKNQRNIQKNNNIDYALSFNKNLKIE